MYLRQILHEILAFKELEYTWCLSKYGSLEVEENVKKLLYDMLSKGFYLIDFDKELPRTFIENTSNHKRVKPDYILIHIGKRTIIPNIVPVEIDWSLREIKRHLPSIALVLPVFIDMFPLIIYGREYVSIKYVDRLIRSVKPLYNILLSPVTIESYCSGGYAIVKADLFSIRYYIDRSVYRKMTVDLAFSLISAIYYDLVDRDLSRKLVPILYTILLQYGLISRIKKYAHREARVHLETIIVDRKSPLRKTLSNLDYRSLWNMLRELINKYIIEYYR